jgi:hypothetical protein
VRCGPLPSLTPMIEQPVHRVEWEYGMVSIEICDTAGLQSCAISNEFHPENEFDKVLPGP